MDGMAAVDSGADMLAKRRRIQWIGLYERCRVAYTVKLGRFTAAQKGRALKSTQSMDWVGWNGGDEGKLRCLLRSVTSFFPQTRAPSVSALAASSIPVKQLQTWKPL
jgi:hypothetical protein